MTQLQSINRQNIVLHKRQHISRFSLPSTVQYNYIFITQQNHIFQHQARKIISFLFPVLSCNKNKKLFYHRTTARTFFIKYSFSTIFIFYNIFLAVKKNKHYCNCQAKKQLCHKILKNMFDNKKSTIYLPFSYIFSCGKLQQKTQKLYKKSIDTSILLAYYKGSF